MSPTTRREPVSPAGSRAGLVLEDSSAREPCVHRASMLTRSVAAARRKRAGTSFGLEATTQRCLRTQSPWIGASNLQGGRTLSSLLVSARRCKRRTLSRATRKYDIIFKCSSHNRHTSTQAAHRTVAQSGHNAMTWGCWGEGGTPASVLHGPRCGRVDSDSPAQASVSSPPLWGLCELSVHTSVHLERRGAVARFRPSREGHRLAEQPADAGGRTACAGRERHWRA